jgi:hypothetical protein
MHTACNVTLGVVLDRRTEQILAFEGVDDDSELAACMRLNDE